MKQDYTKIIGPLVDLVRDAHANSVAKGFWGKGQTALHLKFCLMHSELSEAYEAMIGEGDNGDNFFEECSDTVIRIADLTGRLGGALGPYSIYCGDGSAIPCDASGTDDGASHHVVVTKGGGTQHVYVDGRSTREVTLLRAHLHISRAMEADRNGRPELIVPHLNQCARVLFKHAALEGEDLMEHIEEKMAKNRARPHMHGNKLY